MNDISQPSKTRVLLTAIIATVAYVAIMLAVYAITHKTVMSVTFTNSLAATYVIIWRKRHATSSLITRKPTSSLDILLAVVMIVAINMSATTLALWIKNLLDAPSPIQSVTSELPLAAIIALSIFVAPIGEEALMRGFIYPIMRQRFSAPVTIAFSTLAFAFMHGNIVQIVLTIPLGIACCYVYEHTHSLMKCIGVHMLFNALTVVLPQHHVSATNASIALLMLIVTFNLWMRTNHSE